MTDKVTLANITTFVNDTSAASTYNANNALVTAGFDQCLFLNGTAPNQMQSNLDMNSNRILNLPAPGSVSEPARLIDVTTNPTIAVPPTGTVGAVVPYLNTSNTWSAGQTQTFAGTVVDSGVTTFNSTVTFNTSPSFAGGITLPANSVSSSNLVNNTVTNADLAQMATDTIKGNNTGGTANATDLTIPQVAALFSNPQVTVLTSGTGTYTTPTNAKYLIVEMVGAGGGSGGNGTSAATAGGTGGNSTFGTTFLVANGGAGGNLATGTLAANCSGGTASGGDINISGKGGHGSLVLSGGTGPGGDGGDSYYGGAGLGATASSATAGNVAVGYGSGGGGASGASGTVSGSGGGGAGGWLRKLITSPLSTYSYAVGTAGTAGAAGASGAIGATGFGGLISVTAYFQ
jgi:hypothetical protein